MVGLLIAENKMYEFVYCSKCHKNVHFVLKSASPMREYLDVQCDKCEIILMTIYNVMADGIWPAPPYEGAATPSADPSMTLAERNDKLAEKPAALSNIVRGVPFKWPDGKEPTTLQRDRDLQGTSYTSGSRVRKHS